MAITPEKPVSSFGTHITADYLDQETLLSLTELMDGDAEMISDLIDTLMEDTPALMAELKDAIEAGEISLVHRHAHSLKSSNAQLGAHAFAAICQELENQAKEGELSNAPQLLQQLQQEQQRVALALNDWKNRL